MSTNGMACQYAATDVTCLLVARFHLAFPSLRLMQTTCELIEAQMDETTMRIQQSEGHGTLRMLLRVVCNHGHPG